MASEARPRVHLDELRSALEQVLQRHFQRLPRIRCVRRRRSAYSSSYPIDNVDIELDRDQRLRLVLKNLSPASLLFTAQQVRPDRKSVV